VFVNPDMAGHIIPSGCAAHTELIYGSDGAQYALLDQCPIANPCSGYQGLYKKPIDPVAADRWAYYYTDPNAAAHRAAHGYHGPGVPPGGLQQYIFHTIDEIPEPIRTTLKRAYECEVVVLPTYCPNDFVTRGQMAVFLLKTKYGASYTPPAATGTMFSDVPVTNIYAAWIEELAREGITAGKSPCQQ
jgi:hypothetical protein